MRSSSLRPFLTAAPLVVAMGCSFHSRATHWHDRTGPDGQPVYALTTTTYGFNLGVIVPVLGSTSLDEMVDVATARIAAAGSDHVRLVETESSNYWYALPPLSWIVSPVVTSVTLEYSPSAGEQNEVRQLQMLQEERGAERREQDHSEIVPGPRR